eukprot:TRINITY_DN104258_c0_g1_i1.p2 TRINITY_DN104258_c0_g1~~TRINITY_DN104258_c0_g1_i1.p2  ORF type:complete len:135 (+),score=2.20 TRINITY_DN104258_c0_g1_i1:305-709(+)
MLYTKPCCCTDSICMKPIAVVALSSVATRDSTSRGYLELRNLFNEGMMYSSNQQPMCTGKMSEFVSAEAGFDNSNSQTAIFPGYANARKVRNSEWKVLVVEAPVRLLADFVGIVPATTPHKQFPTNNGSGYSPR